MWPALVSVRTLISPSSYLKCISLSSPESAMKFPEGTNVAVELKEIQINSWPLLSQYKVVAELLLFIGNFNFRECKEFSPSFMDS